MLMNIEEVRNFLPTSESDSMLTAKLSAVESLIRAYTHNNFQRIGYRVKADILEDGVTIISKASMPFVQGDTVMITESVFSQGKLVTVDAVKGNELTIKNCVLCEKEILLTLVEYPMDVKLGAINLLKWELENRDKVGISSESISRHSVTYYNMDGENSVMGYPKSLMGFLKPYVKARF